MKIDILVSTMNQEKPSVLVNDMAITGDYVMINQITELIDTPSDTIKNSKKVMSVHGKGLSKSRNTAIAISNADVCMIADGDMTYVSEYESIVRKAFEDNSDADVIIFRVDGLDGDIKQLPRGRVGLLYSMKVNSKQISFRRKSLVGAGIKFDERFGAGSDLYMGEENILLSDCRRAGLNIISVPEKVASLRPHKSTWSRERNCKYFYIKGRMFTRISMLLSFALSTQFVVRKSGARNDSINMFAAFGSAVKGIVDEVSSRKS